MLLYGDKKCVQTRLIFINKRKKYAFYGKIKYVGRFLQSPFCELTPILIVPVHKAQYHYMLVQVICQELFLIFLKLFLSGVFEGDLEPDLVLIL